MQRAATGLAHAVARLLGASYGARVLLLVGSGDNGGDALWAGAHLARRGCGVHALLLSRRVHAEGLAALRAAGDGGGHGVAPLAGADYDVVLDGVVGNGGRPGLRPEAVAARRPCAVCPWWPSHALGRRRRHRRARRRPRARRPHRHLRHAQGGAPRRPGRGRLRTGAPGRPRPRPAPRRPPRPPAADVAALLPRPAPDAQKYTRGVVGVRAGSATYPGAALLSVAGAATGLVAWCATWATAPSPTGCARPTPRSSDPAGCRPGWSAPGAARPPARSCARRSPTGCPW